MGLRLTVGLVRSADGLRGSRKNGKLGPGLVPVQHAKPSIGRCQETFGVDMRSALR